MSYEQALDKLHKSIQALDAPETLRLLNINEELLEQPSTTLEYVKRCRYWRQMREIVGSIPQLLEQSATESIPLVGFLGHFSSGKSTFINALMEIPLDENPPYKRPAGRHPTDRDITLTTHHDHFAQVEKSNSSVGASVKIVQGPILPLLEHMTLVDTPGLGDRAAERALVTLFLHLVHVLIITVDGRRPFSDTEKDFALLDTAFNRLSAVPKIIVFTNADSFLSTRKGDFDTDWDAAEVEKFWEETVERLVEDPRFAKHRETFQKTPRYFVDSIEGFHVSDVADAVLPIVKDDAQRTRTDAARAEYVIGLAVEALNYLETYVEERGENFNRLHHDAESRAESTQTAIKELVQALTGDFERIIAQLQADRRNAPDLTVPLSKLVTIQTVTQGLNVANVESKIKSSIIELAKNNYHKAIGKSAAAYRARLKGSQTSFDSDLRLGINVESVVDKTQLQSHLRKSPDSALGAVMSQLEQKRIAGLGILESRSERFRVTNALKDIENELSRFEQVHDDSIKGLLAYVTAPSSIELLREHGFVGFDDAGRQITEPPSLAVRKHEDYVSIVELGDKCRDALKVIYDHASKERFSGSDTEAEIDSEPDDIDVTQSPEIDRAAIQPFIDQISAQLTQRVGALNKDINTRLDNLGREYAERNQTKKRRVKEIWGARGAIFLRLLGVVFLVTAIAGATHFFAPNVIPAIWNTLPDWFIQGVAASIVSAIVLGSFVFVLIGTRNEKLMAAFGSTSRQRFSLARLRRDQKRRLKSFCEDRINQCVAEITAAPMSLETTLLSVTTNWLQQQCPHYSNAVEELAEIQQRVLERSRCMDAFINEMGPKLTNIPASLQEASDKIRSDAITNHMVRIREAADSVEQLRSTIASIAGDASNAGREASCR